MKNIAKVLFSLLMVIQIFALIGCGGGGGGNGTAAAPQKNIFTVLANIDKKVSNEADTEIGDLALNGISLNLVKGALAGDSNVSIKQYSNEAAMARLQEQYSELASFTAVSSLYELSAKDKNSNVITSLEEPSEISILIAEDVDSNKIYYAAAKQNGEWILIPLEDGSGKASLRGAASISKTVKLIINSIFESIFIISINKNDVYSSNLTYAENFNFSINNSFDSPQTIAASYTQVFDDDVEVKLTLTMKGELTPDKAAITVTATQNSDKNISLKTFENKYKDYKFYPEGERNKFKTSFMLTSDIASCEVSGDTATYTFVIKAKELEVNNLPQNIVLKAKTKGSSIFYSNDMQINFVKGSEQPIATNSDIQPSADEADINQTIVISFSQPMNTESVEKALKIIASDTAIEASSKEWNKEKNKLTINLENLELNTVYNISIDKTALSSNKIPLKDFSLNFKTKNVAPTSLRYNVSFVARYSRDTYSYEANTGQFKQANLSLTDTILIPHLTCEIGTSTYVTVSWNTKEDGSGISVEPKSEIQVSDLNPGNNENITLYAIWEKVWEGLFTFNIVYYGNGNTSGSVPVDYSSYKEDSTVRILSGETIAKENFVFVSWNTKSDGTGVSLYPNVSVESQTINPSKEDRVALYATWEKTYSVVYDGNGFTDGYIPVDDKIYRESENIFIASEEGFSKSNNAFVCWNTKADGTGININANSRVNINQIMQENSDTITLYAIWENVYRVCYDGNGNTSGTVPEGNTYRSMELFTIASADSISREKYVFVSWNTKADGTGIRIEPYEKLKINQINPNLNANITLYAIWDRVYTVVYNGNGNTSGTAPTDSRYYRRNDTITISSNNDLEKDELYFVSWNTKPDGSGIEVNANSEYEFNRFLSSENMDDDAITLYAIWINRYKIIFDGNGNTSGECRYCQWATENENIVFDSYVGCEKENCYFSSWNTKPDGSGLDIAWGEILTSKVLNPNKKSTVTLYAQWDEIKTYVNGGVISQNTTWNLAGSPYCILGEVHIAEDATLIIEPGVIVTSDYDFYYSYDCGNQKSRSIKAFGKLMAVGNAVSRITFKNLGLQGTETGSLELEYTYIKSSSINSDLYGGLILRNSIVEQCNNHGYPMYISGRQKYDSYIECNIFKDSGNLYLENFFNDATINISNNVFINPIYSVNTTDISCAIYIGCFDSIVIEKNNFITNNKIAIYCGGGYSNNDHVNATNNYWGTTDENVIKNMIYDRNDSLDCKAYVDYAPFLTAPDPDTPIINQ